MLKILFLLFFVASSAYGLQCYYCSSADFPNCKDPFNLNGIPILNCTKPSSDYYTGCTKKEYKNNVTERNCVSYLKNATLNSFCPKSSCSLCGDDLCNQSSHLQISPLTLIQSLVVGCLIPILALKLGL